MTGSGKTGLCLSLLEEAAIDGVPAICIDPKGDLGNLMLTFPNLSPAEFEPVGRRGRRRAQGPFAERTSRRRPPRPGGTASPSGARRRSALRACALPPTWRSTRRASDAGIPLSVLRSFAPPSRRAAGGRGRPARPRRFGGLGPAEPAGHRRRSDRLARAHPARQHPRRRLARRARPRHDRPDPGRAEAGLRQARRVRPRDLLPREGPAQARDAAEQSDRLARASPPG